MSKTTFKFQGINSQTNILEDVQRIISTPNTTIIITTAYLRKGAVEVLNEELKKVSSRGTVIVGIRNGVTSAQALRTLVATGVNLYAVDTGATDLIFHSKIYAAYSDQEANLICGSANFTPSGLWRNFEAITLTKFDLADYDDNSTWSEVLNAVKKVLILGEKNVFKITNKNDVDELLASGRIVDENIPLPQQSVGFADIKEKGENTREKSKVIQKIKAYSKKPNIKNEKPSKTKPSAPKSPSHAVENEPNNSRYREIWKSKPLVRRDLNLPDAKGTNPTGSMLLKKGLYKIDQQTYFREKAFADREWVSYPEKPAYFQYANIKFRFVVVGIDYGIHELEIKYDSRQDTESYRQKQPMASISWGECKQFLADENLLDKTMTIYRDEESGVKAEDGSSRNCIYVIEIA